MIDTTEHYICVRLSDLDLYSSPQECEKAILSVPITSQVLSRFGWLVGWMKFIFTSSHLINVQEQKLCSGDFIQGKKKMEEEISVGLCSDIYRAISYKLSMMIDTTELYCLIPVWMTWIFIQGHCCMRKQKLLHSFSLQFSQLTGMKFSMVPWPVSFLKLMLNLFHTISTPGREPYLDDFMEYTINMGLHLDAYNWNPCTPCMMRVWCDTTELHISIPACNDLDFYSRSCR